MRLSVLLALAFLVTQPTLAESQDIHDFEAVPVSSIEFGVYSTAANFCDETLEMIGDKLISESVTTPTRRCNSPGVVSIYVPFADKNLAFFGHEDNTPNYRCLIKFYNPTAYFFQCERKDDKGVWNVERQLINRKIAP